VARLGSFHFNIPTGKWECSSMLMEILGFDESYPRDLDGMGRLVHPDEREEVHDYFVNEVLGKHRPFNRDCRIIRAKDKQVRWVHVTAVLDLDAYGNPSDLMGNVQDITERMVGVDELRASERRFHSIVDNVNDGFIIHDLHGHILDCNENECQMLGYRKEELVGQSLSKIDSEKDAGFFEERTRILKETGKVEFDGTHIRKDGAEVQVTVSARMISGEGKGIIQSFIRDITERKKSERALLESEQRFRTLAESLPQGVFETDLKGKLLYGNKSAMEMFQYNREDFDNGLHIGQMIAPQDRLRAKKAFQLILSGATRGSEYAVLRKDGTTFPAMIYTNPKREGDRVTGSIGLVMDATETKRAEEERRKLQEQFFQAQKMESIGTLAGGVAHDFNNLLSGILGSLSIMELDVEDNEEMMVEIQEMKALVKRGAGLTRQMMGFARRGKYDAKPLDLLDVIKKTSELYNRTRKDIVIMKEFFDDHVIVLGDRSQLEQVWMNLFVNAGQAMPQGGKLSIQVAKVESSSDEGEQLGLPMGPFAQVRIKDNGHGMDEETLGHIFEPFFTTKEAGKGTGLGLASVYGIVKNHGGFVKANSRLGKGTTFWVYLPLTDLSPAVETVSEAEPLNGASYAKRMILLVDDEEPILRTCTKALEKIGFIVRTAVNGREALELFKAHQDEIAVVILDMVMPGLTGMETFEAMKAMDPKVKVLLASGYSYQGQAEAILEDGCRGFIEKPFDIEALSAKLREII
jgi:PAS domain S-box-containing protein